MKLNGLIAAAVALVLVSCQKPAAETATQQPSLEPPIPASTPVVAVAEPPAPPAPVRDLAPDGVFYLRAKKSLTTEDGIVGFAPGTVLRKNASGEYVTPSNQILKLDEHEVTNDLAEARQLAGQNAAVRAATARNIAAMNAPATPVPSVGQDIGNSRQPPPSRPSAGPLYVDGVSNQVGGLQSSTGLGASHTKHDDGWLWQKSPDGRYWIPVKRLDGRPYGKPLPRLVR